MFEIQKGAGAIRVKTIRLPDELFQHLDELARDNGISMNALIMQCCNYALCSMEKQRQEG